MTAAQRAVLSDEGGRHFLCGTAQYLSASARATPAIIERGFRNQSGGGVAWADFGSDAVEGIARMSQTTHRELLPSWVASVPEAMNALGRSAPRILDVGCGFGESTLSLAAAFCTANVVGIDPDAPSLQRARASLAQRRLANVSFIQCGLEDVAASAGDAPFDLVLAYDCIHDIPDPVGALGSVHRLLQRDPSRLGVFLWFEPHGSDDPLENREILGARMVAGMALNCVATSMASGGAGFGAHGCTPARAEAIARDVGFGLFRHERELKGARFRNNVYVLQ